MVMVMMVMRVVVMVVMVVVMAVMMVMMRRRGRGVSDKRSRGDASHYSDGQEDLLKHW